MNAALGYDVGAKFSPTFTAETANGANQYTRVGEVCQPSFADHTAAATGASARSIRQDAERGEKVCSEALANGWY